MDALIVFEPNTFIQPQSMKFLYVMLWPQGCLIPCYIIDRYWKGIPPPHINKHGTLFKMHNTYFLHSYHPHSTQVPSRLQLLKTNPDV